MEDVKIYKRPRLKNPILIVAWPGMGDVAFKSAFYLIEQLKAVEFAQIMPGEFFYLTGSIIDKGILSVPQMPYSKFYFWKNKTGKNDLIIFLSNAQPDLAKAQSYCEKILKAIKTFNVKTVIGFAAMPQGVEHTTRPKVWFSSTSEELNSNLKKFDISVLSGGQISGMNGLFLGVAKKHGLDGFCLLGEIPLYTIQIENPRASQAVLEAAGKILNIKIDFTSMMVQAQAIEEEINKLLDYLKIGPQSAASAPIGEDEIEKIKKALGQLTKLPVSIKERIEALFIAAKSDLSKANELKAELDNWNVYKEYEDRFLDLFKKTKDKSN